MRVGGICTDMYRYISPKYRYVQIHFTKRHLELEITSKLRTYAIFKKDIGFEKYLYNIKNPTSRAILTKFRLSNQKLMIEVGRYTNIPKEMRFCHFCPNMEL